MDYGTGNTDWILVFTVVVCTWFLGAKIQSHRLTQKNITDANLRVLEKELLEIKRTLKTINENSRKSKERLDRLEEYVRVFWWEKTENDRREREVREREHQELQSEIKERNRLRRLAKEKGLKVLGASYSTEDLQRVLDEGIREQEGED